MFILPVPSSAGTCPAIDQERDHRINRFALARTNSSFFLTPGGHRQTDRWQRRRARLEKLGGRPRD